MECPHLVSPTFDKHPGRSRGAETTPPGLGTDTQEIFLGNCPHQGTGRYRELDEFKLNRLSSVCLLGNLDF